jgi:hypothetical protein
MAELGENRNLHAAIRPDGFVVCCDGAGQPVVPDFVPYVAPDAAPTPIPEPPMPSTPDHRFVLDAVNRDHPELLRENTHESCGLFTELAVLALHAIDEGWGHVSKPADGRNAYQGHAVDAVKYRSTGQVVDIIRGAGDRHPTETDWGFQPSRSDEPWMAPRMPQDDPGSPPDDDPDLPPVCQCEALQGRLDSLERAVAAQAEVIAALDTLVLDLRTAPPRQYVATVDVGRTLGHTHRVQVKIDPV